MSDEQSQIGDQEVQEQGGNSDDSVDIKAYKKVSEDMHKYKAEKKEMAMQLAKLKADLESQQTAKLEEQNRYEELYRKAEDEKNRLLTERQQEKQLFVDAVKKSALKTELGSNIKDQYLNLADFSKIEVREDGSLDSESVREAANRFRQDHPALVPSSASGSINSVAPQSQPSQPKGPKSVNEMTIAEKTAALLQMKQQKS